MSFTNIGVEGGCSTPENPVLPFFVDADRNREVGHAVIVHMVCQANPPDSDKTIELVIDGNLQEQLAVPCKGCHLNVHCLQNITRPPWA